MPLKAGNERFLHKINSSNVDERNEAIQFLANGTEWIDGYVFGNFKIFFILAIFRLFYVFILYKIC